MNDISPSDIPPAPVIVWFRNDLRVADNLALSMAAESGNPVLALFVLEDARDALPLGAAQAWWLHHSLTALSGTLETLGVPLLLRRGEPLGILREVTEATGARTVLWNRRYVPSLSDRDAKIKQALRDDGMTVASFAGQLLHEPTRLRTGSGGPYKVFTPFWRAFQETVAPRAPAPAPKKRAAPDLDIRSDELEDWALLPRSPDWSGGIGAEWTPGENGARERLARFIDEALAGYAEKRDFPAIEHTSRLSPHLAFGEITPAQIWHATGAAIGDTPARDLDTFRKEVAWREFSYHLLVNFPGLTDRNFNADFDAFAWKPDATAIDRWRKGMTGYPIVDAGMRQLWQTGWMHNRVRMIVGSFLVKHLLTDWRVGEAWFRDTLVDADPASNAASWQWIAGSGADAAPYFRIFNPILQGEKFDPQGVYVRRFIPELAGPPDRYLHQPWTAPNSVLDEAAVKLDTDYPRPVVDHKGARDRAMMAYKAMKAT